MEEITDSTDWLATPLASLAPVESALRCQVCKDFFVTPMITSCSHTFCSICIRRYLSQEGKCPACRESDQEMKLRRNWAVEEMVAQFTQARRGILDFAKRSIPEESVSTNNRPKKRRKLDNAPISTERRSTRSQSRRVISSQAEPELSSTQELEVQDSEEDATSLYEEQSSPVVPELNDGRVDCPNCSRRIKEILINSHLDRCLIGQAGKTPSPSGTPIPQFQGQIQPGSIAYSQNKSLISRDRLPTINYSLLNDNALRKKLRDLGIPFTGSKELMRKRHTEWVNLWNANCDSQKPRTKQALLGELNTWERTLGRQIDRNTATGNGGVMVKDFDRDGWQKTNKGDFDDLIQKAREKRKTAVTAVTAADATDATTTTDALMDPMDQSTQPTENQNDSIRMDDSGDLHASAISNSALKDLANSLPNGYLPHRHESNDHIKQEAFVNSAETVDVSSPSHPQQVNAESSQRSRMFL